MCDKVVRWVNGKLFRCRTGPGEATEETSHEHSRGADEKAATICWPTPR